MVITPKHKIHFKSIMVLTTIALILIGLVVIYSASIDIVNKNLFPDIFTKQVIWAGMSIILFIIVTIIPFQTYYAFSYLLYAINILFLISLFFFPPAMAGARRWIVLGPINIQPSEFAKITTIFVIARFLSDSRLEINKIKNIIKVSIITLIPMVLILKEPDLGTCLVFIPIFFGLIYWRGLKPFNLFVFLCPLLSIVTSFSLLPWMILMIILLFLLYINKVSLINFLIIFIMNLTMGLITPYLWNHLETYQQRRILTFLDPERDPLSSGYQIIQSKVAIGSGGLLGKGLFEGTQKKLAFLPERHTDFIFSVVGEELGLIGSIFILLLFFMLLYWGINIAKSARNQFASLVVIGGVCVILFHVGVNVGVTLGIMPVTGVPLPFLSYGGSSLMSAMVIIALFVNVGMRRFEY